MNDETRQEELQFIYNNLDSEQKILFFKHLIDTDFDVDESVYLLFSNEYKHDDIMDISIFPGNKIVVGMDFIEMPVVDDPDDMIVKNIIHFYSNKEDNITNFLLGLFEEGEILTTMKSTRKHKTKYYKCYQSLNFENRPERPIIPICYN